MARRPDPTPGPGKPSAAFGNGRPPPGAVALVALLVAAFLIWLLLQAVWAALDAYAVPTPESLGIPGIESEEKNE